MNISLASQLKPYVIIMIKRFLQSLILITYYSSEIVQHPHRTIRNERGRTILKF